MGGGDLNLKKEWHPATFKNQEDVWKREQAVLAEQRKTQQLQKEKEEERLREEIEKAMPGGRKKMRQKLDWMYSMGAQNNSTSHIDEDKEAFLLGKKKITQIENEPKTDPNAPKRFADQDRFKDEKASIYGGGANTPQDIQAKVRDDPLLAFKRQEQASLEAIMANPLRLKQLKESKKKAKKEKKDSESRLGKEGKRYTSPARDDKERSSRTDRRRSRSPIGRNRSRSPIGRNRSRSPIGRNSARSPIGRNRSRSPIGRNR